MLLTTIQGNLFFIAATCKTFTQYPSNKQSFNSEDLAYSSLMQCADKRSYHSEI